MYLLKSSWRIVTYFYHRFFDDQCATHAASLAYATLLTLVPLALVCVYVLSLFPHLHGVGDSIQKFIIQNFVATSANVVSQFITSFVKQITVLSWVNIASLVVVCILLMFNMVGAFNAIWHTQMERHLALSFAIYLAFLLLTPVLFAILLLMSSYVASLPLINILIKQEVIIKPLVYVMPYGVAFLIFTFFNWMLPSCKVKLRYAAVAGLVTMILFEIAKYGFGLYIRLVPTYRLIYGALATIPIFLIWLYVTWVIVLFGALLCNVMSEGRE